MPGNTQFSGSSANTFTGPLTVQCQELELDKPSGTQAYAGPLIVGGGLSGICEAIWLNPYQNVGATVTLYTNGLVNLNNNNEDFGPVTFNGGHIATGSGQCAIYQPLTVNPAGSTAIIDGHLGLPPGNPATFIVPNGFTFNGIELQVNAQIFGTAPYLVKQGAGTMSLASANISSATTLLQGGTLAMDNATALGTMPVVISGGATLKWDVSTTLTQGFEMSGDGVNGALGVIDVPTNIFAILKGSVLLDTETTLNIAGNLQLNGVISGTGPLTQVGAGELDLGGNSANTYSGDMFAKQGILELLKPDGVTAVPGNLTIGTKSSFINNNGTTATAVSVQNAAIAGTNVTVNGGSLLNLSVFSQSLATVVLNNGGSISASLGTLSFTGPNTLAAVTVNPGKGGNSVISGNVHFNQGGNFVVGLASQPLFGSGPELDLPAVLSESSPGTFTKNGAGQMQLSTNNTFSSTMTVNGGKLTLANSGALGNSPSTTVNSNSVLTLNGGITGIAIQNIPLMLNSGVIPALQSSSGSNLWTGPITLGQTTAVDVEPASGYLNLLNAVSGPGGLTVIGFGSLQFQGSNANTYAGVTTVSNGAIETSRIGTQVVHTIFGNKTNKVAIVSIPGDASIGSDTTTTTVATVRLLTAGLANTANVTVHLSGLLDLPSGGAVNGAAQTFQTLNGAGPVNIALNSSLNLNNPGPFTYYGTISGGGLFGKQGAGTMTIYGNVNTTGQVTVLGGDWELFGARHNGGIIMAGGRLGGDGSVDGLVIIENGATNGVDSHFPDHRGGVLHVGSLSNILGSTVQLDMFGSSPTGGNDQIATTSGGVFLSSDSTLSTSFSYPPHDGDVIDLISVASGQSFTGYFANYPDGIVTLVGNTPVLPSYEGGSGHDFTLTVTNLALAYTGYHLAEGNGNQTVEPNECNLLYVSLVNRRNNALTITNAFLRATNTTGVLVTVPLASYPVIAAGQTMTNLTPFQFSTDTNLECGGAVGFELVVGVVNEGQFAIAFNPVSGSDCSHPTGPCDSCTVASGQFTTNTPTLSQPLYVVGAPSICFPPKAYPGTNPIATLPSAPYLTHSFTNTTTNLLCITAQLEFDCPSAPTNALGVAAYLGTFDPNNPSVGYLGDIGQGSPPYPAFSFQVPASTNFTLVVMAQATNLVCNNYTLQLFGLPCPPPVMAITNDTVPAAVRVHWSTAYPGFTAQQSGKLSGGTFTNVIQSPVILNGRYSLPNLHTATNQFFRLKK